MMTILEHSMQKLGCFPWPVYDLQGYVDGTVT